MAVKVIWEFDPSVAVTSFTLDKSVDQGTSYTFLATVTFDINGANFDRAEKHFFYNDAAGAPGHIYRITATGAFGTSLPSYMVAPADPPGLCVVIGYARNAFGEVDVGMQVFVESWGERGTGWASNPAGVVGNNAQSLAVISSTRTTYPDANGLWQVELIRKAYARVRIPALELDWAFEVPDKTGPVNIRDLPLVRQGDVNGTFPEMTGVAPRIVRS